MSNINNNIEPIAPRHEGEVILLHTESWSDEGRRRTVEVYSDGSRRIITDGDVEEVGEPPNLEATLDSMPDADEREQINRDEPLFADGKRPHTLTHAELNALAAHHDKGHQDVESLPSDAPAPAEEAPDEAVEASAAEDEETPANKDAKAEKASEAVDTQTKESTERDLEEAGIEPAPDAAGEGGDARDKQKANAAHAQKRKKPHTKE